MEKSETMKKFEERTGKQAIYWTAFGPEISQEYIDEIEARYEAYDRLMSGGVITKKDVANVFGKVLVMTPNGYWQLWFSKPRRDKWGWHLDGGDTKSIGHTIAHFSDLNIIHDGSWEDSLTLPDGWEEK